MDKISDERQDEFMPIEESDYYLAASTETQDALKGRDLFITREPVLIAEGTSTYQNFTNGMMNLEADAIKNGLSQTHNQQQDGSYESALLTIN